MLMLEDTLKKLADSSQSLTHKLLRSLSGLDRSELNAVQSVWPTIAAERRRRITHALVEMAEDDAEMDFVDLFTNLLTDPDAEVRAAAVNGLWETTDERLVDPLIALMRADPSPLVRAAAADILGHFGLLGPEEQLYSERHRRLLAALLETFYNQNDPLNTVEVRRNALESAAYFDDDAVAAAIRAAYASPDLALRAGALSAMGLTFDDAWQPIVLEEMDSPEPELRYEAAEAAGNLWLEAAVPKLIAMTKDPDQEVRLMAIWSLGEIGGKAAKETLTALQRSSNEAVRQAAEEALEEILFNENPLGFNDVVGDLKKKSRKQ